MQLQLTELQREFLAQAEKLGWLIRGTDLMIEYGPSKAQDLVDAIKPLEQNGFVKISGPSLSPKTVFDGVYVVRPSNAAYVKSLIA